MTPPTPLQVLIIISSMLVSTHYLTCARRTGILPFSAAGSGNGVCPSESTREELKSSLQQEIRAQLQNYTQNGEEIPGGIAKRLYINISIKFRFIIK